MSVFTSVAVVGRGLIGGSIERAVRQHNPELRVLVLDRGDAFEGLRQTQLVILCAPVCANIELLGLLRGVIGTSTVITDVSSTKAAITAAAAGMRFVGGHPIAGAARGGPENAAADLFAGKPWILTRGTDATPEDAARVERFVTGLGAEPRWMDADAHDRLFALLSHLPQLAVSALMDVIARSVDQGDLQLAGAGLRDSTRLASSPPDVWADIVATNRPAIREALRGLIATLADLRDDETGRALADVFRRAAAARARLDGQ